MQVIDVYTKKAYTCKKCNGEIYYGKITDDKGNIYTVDGHMPNGKYGKETNVISGAVDALVKDRLHECSKHYVEEAIAKAPAPPTGGGVKIPEKTTFANFQAEYVNEADRVQWNDVVAKVVELTILAQKKLDEYPEITNPALKGLITNQAFAVWSSIKESQRNG